MAQTCIYGHLEERNVIDPAVSRLEMDDNVPRREHEQPGQRPKSDRFAPKVLYAVDGGRSYRWFARDLGISKNTGADIVKRHQAAPASSPPARGALDQLQRKPHCAGIGGGSRRWLRTGHGRERYHGPMNRDTVTVKCDRMGIL